MPVLGSLYRYDQYRDAWDTGVHIDVDGERVGFFHTVKEGVDRVWIDHHTFLGKVRSFQQGQRACHMKCD